MSRKNPVPPHPDSSGDGYHQPPPPARRVKYYRAANCRCGYHWHPLRAGRPGTCPRCVSRQWDRNFARVLMDGSGPMFTMGRRALFDAERCAVCLAAPQLARPLYGVPPEVARASYVATVARAGIPPHVPDKIPAGRAAMLELIRRSGRNVAQLSRATGIERTWLVRLFRGELRKPDLVRASELAREMRVSLDALADALMTLWREADAGKLAKQQREPLPGEVEAATDEEHTRGE